MPWPDLAVIAGWVLEAACWLALCMAAGWLAYSARRLHLRARRRMRAAALSLIGAVLGWCAGASVGSGLPYLRIVADEFDFSSAGLATGALLMLAGAWLGARIAVRLEGGVEAEGLRPDRAEGQADVGNRNC